MCGFLSHHLALGDNLWLHIMVRGLHIYSITVCVCVDKGFREIYPLT